MMSADTDVKIKLSVGDKVHYIPFEGCDKSQYENGIVKFIPFDDNSFVFVVYKCANKWTKYRDYTSVRTNVEQLKKGWYKHNKI